MEWLKPQIVWFVVGFIMILLEFSLPGLITVFFGIGAWLVALLCFFLDLSVNLQLLIFLVSSVALLVFLRKWFKSLFLGHYATSAEEIENLEEYVGQKAVVTKAITPNKRGKVQFHGTYWEAEAYENLAKGTAVEIIDKDNITLIVKSL